MNKKIPPVHPGEILFEEFLKPMGISQNRLAIDIRVPARRINEIVLKKKEEYQRTRRCAWPNFSKCRLNSGRVCRWIMIWM